MMEYELVAREMMEHIAYDNGFVNRVDGPMAYPKRHLNRITKAAKAFFEANPEMLTNENVEWICSGLNEKEEQFEDMHGHLAGFAELDKALDNYFEH